MIRHVTFCGGGPFVASACSGGGEHTAAPTGYVAWHEWAEEMAGTHRQIKCPGCGLYAVWVPK